LKNLYRQAMEWLYIACIGLAGVVMLVMTIIIPYGVFMRYVVNSPASWPEPAGILMMVWFSFIGGAAAYRAKAHIAVSTVLNMMNDTNRVRMERVADQVGRAAGAGHLAEHHRRVSGAVGRRDLPADSGFGRGAAVVRA